MTPPQLQLAVRAASPTASIIDITGEITAFAETQLMNAYEQANRTQPRAIVLNFTGLDYMNSGGIGLLVTLMIRLNRQHQRLLAYGLNDHYQHIFELTRLTDAIGIYASEAAAVAAA